MPVDIPRSGVSGFLHTALPRAWVSRGGLARCLWPLSWVYGALVGVRASLYRRGWLRSTRLPVPVLVVGNVVVGGAGKTPTVIAIVQHLTRLGHRPGVVSRGHGRQAAPGETLPPVLEVLPDTPAHCSGDEPALVRQATGVPVFVGRSRAAAGQALLARYPHTTVIVCDDGLQHLSLHADVSVAVFDERGVGNGWLLPAGLLREPWPRHTGRRVDMVLHVQPAGADPAPLPLPPGVPRFAAQKRLGATATGIDWHRVPLSALASVRPTALAGIAKPQAFFDMLGQAGVPTRQHWALADHQDFSALVHDPRFLAAAQTGLVCTEKDAVKLFPLLKAAYPDHAPQTLKTWSVDLVFTPDLAFFEALNQRLSSIHGLQTA